MRHQTALSRTNKNKCEIDYQHPGDLSPLGLIAPGFLIAANKSADTRAWTITAISSHSSRCIFNDDETTGENWGGESGWVKVCNDA